MALTTTYTAPEPTRSAVDAMLAPTVIEFGTPWCGYCQAAQPHIASAFAAHPGVAHLKIEDGRGKPLGRSFAVKLWPTLVFLKEGREVARVVRPSHAGVLAQAFAQFDAQP